MKDLHEGNMFGSVRDRLSRYEEAPSDELWGRIERAKDVPSPSWPLWLESSSLGAIAVMLLVGMSLGDWSGVKVGEGMRAEVVREEVVGEEVVGEEVMNEEVVKAEELREDVRDGNSPASESRASQENFTIESISSENQATSKENSLAVDPKASQENLTISENRQDNLTTSVVNSENRTASVTSPENRTIVGNSPENHTGSQQNSPTSMPARESATSPENHTVSKSSPENLTTSVINSENLTTPSDSLQTPTTTKTSDPKTSKPKTVIPPYKKPKSKFQLFLSLTPSLSFQKIIPTTHDQVIIEGFEHNSPLSIKRFGFSIDAGFQRNINNIFGYYGALTFYRQQQELTYQYFDRDADVNRIGDSWTFEINRPQQTRTFDYTMNNIGLRSGILVTLKGEKLQHKFGAGLIYSHGLTKSIGSYNNSQSSYLSYQLFYRNEVKINDRISWFVEPTFIYGFVSKEKLAEPFRLKPYRAGISAGILYRF